MKFQKKIVFSFVGFSAIIILILIGIYSYFSFKDLKKTEYENTRMVATTKAKQFEDMLKKMDNVSLYLLSDQSFLDATVTVSRSTNKSYEDIYFNEDVTVIRNALNNYYFMKQFYRVIYFNENDIVIANNNFNSTNKIDNNVHVKDIPWLPKVKNTVGENQVIGIHKDDWDYLNNYDVLSTVMEIQGNDRGFIEVQQKKEAIDSFMNDEVMNMDYVVLDTKNGELIYTNNEDINYTEYIDIIGKNNKNIYKYENL